MSGLSTISRPSPYMKSKLRACSLSEKEIHLISSYHINILAISELKKKRIHDVASQMGLRKNTLCVLPVGSSTSTI